MTARHLPVMPGEVVGYLNPEEGGVYIDATVGPGGHSEEILRRIGSTGTLLCIDRDREALAEAEKRLGREGCVFRLAVFSDMMEVAGALGIKKVDGVLFDFGLSMLQVKAPERGFGFGSEGPLDMRMDREGELSADEIVNTWPEKDLERILREFGEERRSKRIVSAISKRRKKAPIRTCRELADIVGASLGRRGRTHPATRTFQALRIAVNDELGHIGRGLVAALGLLAPGGRMVAISYHSLEDRAVKRFMREAEREGRMRVLTKKPVTPGRDEISKNPSARSAKLRAGEAL
jgi:16S rRNA (cytosine1402-N4)-methyltransferase